MELASLRRRHQESSSSLPLKISDVNPLRRYARGCERLFHVCHEASWPAEIDVRLSRDADLVEDRSRQVTGGVEILAHLVVRVRLAVTNIPAAVGEREHEAADFGGEWMMLPITSRVQPRSGPCGITS